MVIQVQKLRSHGENEKKYDIRRELALINPERVDAVERAQIPGWPNAIVVTYNLEQSMILDEKLEAFQDRVNAACGSLLGGDSLT